MGLPVQHQVRDLRVPGQPAVPVRAEQLLQAELVPRERGSQVLVGHTVGLLRGALSEVRLHLEQQGVVCGPCRAAVPAEQLDLRTGRV